MDDTCGVDGANGVGEAAPEVGHLLRAQGTALVDHLVEGVTGYVLGGDVGTLAVRIGGDDGSDVGVVDALERVDLARETRARIGVVGDVRAKNLDGDLTTTRVGGVDRSVHDAHAALTDLLRDLEAPHHSVVPLRAA